MTKVPSRLHAAAEDALKLAGRDAFLAGAHQVDGLKPEPKRQLAFLEDRAHPDRERLPAGIALAQARAGRLAGQPPDAFLIVILAVRADRATGPKLTLDVFESGILVVEAIFGKD